MSGKGHEDGRPAGRIGRASGESEREAASAIWRAHRRWVAAILLAHKPREAELEDLLQEVAMRLTRHIDDLNDPVNVRPWLRVVAMNVARTAGRRQKVRRSVFTPGEVDAEGTPDRSLPDSTREAREEGRRAMALAQGLPLEYREPLLLRAVRGLGYRQIADILGVPVTTIETRLTRARRMLREELIRERSHDVVARVAGKTRPSESRT